MRAPSLRQIEAFRAVVETGTVSRAADLLRISQPAASKLINYLEADTGLQLFDRDSGRLVLTERGSRLYQEIDRVFSGVDQIALIVESIRREERGRIKVGVMPGLSGSFIARVVKEFSIAHPQVMVSVEERGSQYLGDWLISGQLDVGIVTNVVEQSHLESSDLCDAPFVCILPKNHPLGDKKQIAPSDLTKDAFIAFSSTGMTARRIEEALASEGVRLPAAFEAATTSTICGMVAHGLGCSIVHPALLAGVKDEILVRPFQPTIESSYLICRPKTARHIGLVTAFVHHAKLVASATISEIMQQSAP